MRETRQRTPLSPKRTLSFSFSKKKKKKKKKKKNTKNSVVVAFSRSLQVSCRSRLLERGTPLRPRGETLGASMSLELKSRLEERAGVVARFWRRMRRKMLQIEGTLFRLCVGSMIFDSLEERGAERCKSFLRSVRAVRGVRVLRDARGSRPGGLALPEADALSPLR